MTDRSRKSDLRDALPSSPLTALMGKRTITRADVAALRHSDLAVGLGSRAEAEAMFAIERSPATTCRAWGEFLVESLTAFLVWDQRPSGALSEDAAAWLLQQVGEVPTPASLGLLVAVLDEAAEVPAWFVSEVRRRAGRVFGREPQARLAA